MQDMCFISCNEWIYVTVKTIETHLPSQCADVPGNHLEVAYDSRRCVILYSINTKTYLPYHTTWHIKLIKTVCKLSRPGVTLHGCCKVFKIKTSIKVCVCVCVCLWKQLCRYGAPLAVGSSWKWWRSFFTIFQ